MKPSRITIGKLRREEIVAAAVAIIHEQGIENLSLSAIEQKTGMSRGQLTYYFRTKEDILLAVFDHMLDALRGRRNAPKEDNPLSLAHKPIGWERMSSFLQLFLLAPPHDPAFHSLLYTFLGQMLHREDFRLRLANLYAEWRTFVAEDAAVELERSSEPRASPQTVASLVQALLHGLAVLRNADPEAYDRQEMLQLILHLLGGYLRPTESTAPASTSSSEKKPRRSRRKTLQPKEADSL